MNDDRLEQRIRDSFSQVDLPAAPTKLFVSVERMPQTEARVRTPTSGLAVVCATLVLIAVLGSLQLGNGRALAPDRSPSPAGSDATGSSSTPPATSRPRATPEPSPTFGPEPTLPQAPAVDPAPDDVLALAGRGGVPGLLTCGSGFVFGFDAFEKPPGAEDLPGPEYDALREFFRVNVAAGDPQLGPDPSAREVFRSDGRVGFLIDRADPGPWGDNGGPYLHAQFDRAGDTWRWSGSGDCQPRAWPPPGYLPATWTLDPAHSAPTARTRALHILVHERSCSGGRDASGRIGPAYVVTDEHEVHIEILVMDLPRGSDCQGNPLTPARLSLPERIGDRMLRDTNAHLLSGSGG
jgi:hypothetical protein